MRPEKSKVNIEVLLLKKEFQLQLHNYFEVLSEERGEDVEICKNVRELLRDNIKEYNIITL